MNVVDHHQLLNHPLLIGNNVVAGGHDILTGNRGALVVFSCANVGPGNEYMRRGFLFAGRNVPYFSAKEHRDAIYYVGHRKFDFVERQKNVGRWYELAPSEREFLRWFQDHLNSLDYSRCRNHRDQITVAVRSVWPLLFDLSLRRSVPDLLYANAEEVFGHFLGELFDDENYLCTSIFDPLLRQRVLQQFNGIFGGWDRQLGKGTHLFWLKHPSEPRLVRLWVDGDYLVPADPRLEHLTLELTRERVGEALCREEILPCVALWFSAALYAGVTPLVGPNSLIYATELKHRWISVLEEMGEQSEVDLLGEVKTDRLIAGAPLFFARRNGLVQTSSAADLIAAGGASAEYLTTIFHTRFRDLLCVGAPGIHELFATHAIPDDRPLSRKPGLNAAAEAVHSWL